MHAFDANENLKKYDNPQDIIDEFYIKRLEIYHKRKDKQLEDGYLKLDRLSNKARYIKCLLNDEIDLRKKKNTVIVEMLEKMKFNKVDDNYNYLIKMPMDSVSEENVEKIMKEKDELSEYLKELQNTTVENIWLKELTKLEEEYNIYIKNKSCCVTEKKIIKKKK
jgi:DNA topoisomerase-2